ncbi:RsmB/NOP family class I SAM-dependent RNA methyltransferase [Sphingomonas lacunae]|nr:RsmB/NOP family class I SAM-dependent RNA methyltransferase [Sphingomonas lacunae]
MTDPKTRRSRPARRSPAQADDDGRNVPGFPARLAAMKLLDAVIRRGESMDAVAANATRGLAPPDRALAIAISAEVCRHLVDLDALIDSATAQPLPADVKARMALRIALVQALVLGTPPHAAIATALPLVSGGPRKLVHGVFGTLIRAEAKLPAMPTLPEDVALRWTAAWGPAMVEGASAALAAAPPLDLTIKEPARTAEWAERLGGVSMIPGHVRLPRGGDVTRLGGFAEGAWWVQDLSAALPARLLGSGKGRTVLDIGAAPGGKTMQLAAAGWTVTGLDASERRLDRLSQNLARTGLEAECLRGDGRKLPDDREWDAVLLDAPCSATGIFRRHPDVLHRIMPRDIANRAELQALMLDAAAGVVKAGGSLVFATCSLEPEEGEGQIDAFLARQPYWSIDPIRTDEVPAGVHVAEQGWLRITPPDLAEAGGVDGFFMARLRLG